MNNSTAVTGHWFEVWVFGLVSANWTGKHLPFRSPVACFFGNHFNSLCRGVAHKAVKTITSAIGIHHAPLTILFKSRKEQRINTLPLFVFLFRRLSLLCFALCGILCLAIVPVSGGDIEAYHRPGKDAQIEKRSPENLNQSGVCEDTANEVPHFKPFPFVAGVITGFASALLLYGALRGFSKPLTGKARGAA